MPRSDKKNQPGKKPVATIPTLSLEELQKKRTNYAKELQRRGGSKNAPGYAKKFNETTQSIRDLRKNPPAETPAAASPIYAPDNFDWEGYLANNKDVNESIRGQLISGSSGDRGIADLAYEHWKNQGRAEGRGEQYFRMPGDPYPASPDAPPTSTSPTGAETEQGTTITPPDFWSSAYENNPSYRYARDEAQSEMSKFLSAKGLRGSGAEISNWGKMTNQLVANEADRVANEQYRWSEMMARNAQQSADRSAQVGLSEAEASRQKEQDYWNNFYRFAGLAQQNDPTGYMMGAGSAMSDVLGKKGSAYSNYYSNTYAKPTQGVVPSGGGGGGGGYVAPFMPPRPTNSSQLPYANAYAGLGSGNAWNNAWNQFWGGLYGSK